ncbi:MAG: DEAD/DEAH box helicase [Desulfuromonadales bacterium]|jgi:ATP-dependent RNA helicase RhlE
MSFSDFNFAPNILKAILECGYETPTPIQAQAIPKALAGHDLIGSAQTGTGKTAAFMLPTLQKLSTGTRTGKGAPRVLVLTPTRELAGQVLDATRSYGKYLGLRSAILLGGMPYREQFRSLAQPLDLVVATPGRLIDHLERGSLNLSAVEVLVLDEADRMLDMGFKEDVEKITAATPAGRQTLLFTATMDRTMADLARKLLRDPVRIDIAGKSNSIENIDQRLHLVDDLQHKHRMLRHLVTDNTLTQAIIFSATKRDADTLARELTAQGHRAAALHGDMTQAARNRTVRDLRLGRIRLLVATDVAARGLDISGISHVINFDLPKFAEDYVHRIGRTGRAGASGTAISLASGNDLAPLQRIQRYIGSVLPRYVIPGLEPTRAMPTSERRPGPGRRPEPGGRKGAPAGRKNYGAGSKREPVVEYRRKSRPV